MSKNIDYMRLIERAQNGDKQGLEHLSELAEERLREDVGRITLNPDLTQDIVQETMLEMLKKLDKLKEIDRFWKWLTNIAYNKINNHHRKEKRYKTAPSSSMRDTNNHQHNQEAVAELIGKEFQQIVSTAMQQLKPRHRMVLTLRCYRDMTYAEIAEVMDCSEFAAMMLFHRAKKTLGKQLSRHGYGKGLLIPALVLFGKLTASTEASAAQISLCSAVTKSGILVGLAGLATSKTTLVCLGIASVVSVGTVVTRLKPQTPVAGIAQESIPSVLTTGSGTQKSTRTGEYWYYFPEGPSGPVMMRVTSEVDGRQSNFKYLQNDSGNYTFDNRSIHINNQRLVNEDLSVFQLPTDSPELTEFISRTQGYREPMEYIPNRGRNLFIRTTYDSQNNTHSSQNTNQSNVLNERYFLPDLPSRPEVIDHRDDMHKRGWTYFRIDGQIDGKQVFGTGRLPFVYQTSKQYSPWLKIQISDGSQIIDSTQGASIIDKDGKIIEAYQARTFFSGLSRPWMGLHSIDTVRRDAAKEHIDFETKIVNGTDNAEVSLTYEQTKLIYTINMESDVVEKISFSTEDGEGELNFSYLQDIDNVGNEFTPPRTGRSRSVQQNSPGVLWLLKLTNNHL